MIDITRDNYPRVYALLTRLYGAHGMINRQEPQPDVYRVPGRFVDMVPHIDIAVEHLTEDEIDAFVGDGEEGEALAIAARNPSLTAAHQLLDAILDGEDDEAEHHIGRTELSHVRCDKEA